MGILGAGASGVVVEESVMQMGGPLYSIRILSACQQWLINCCGFETSGDGSMRALWCDAPCTGLSITNCWIGDRGGKGIAVPSVFKLLVHGLYMTGNFVVYEELPLDMGPTLPPDTAIEVLPGSSGLFIGSNFLNGPLISLRVTPALAGAANTRGIAIVGNSLNHNNICGIPSGTVAVGNYNLNDFQLD